MEYNPRNILDISYYISPLMAFLTNCPVMSAVILPCISVMAQARASSYLYQVTCHVSCVTCNVSYLSRVCSTLAPSPPRQPGWYLARSV